MKHTSAPGVESIFPPLSPQTSTRVGPLFVDNMNNLIEAY